MSDWTVPALACGLWALPPVTGFLLIRHTGDRDRPPLTALEGSGQNPVAHTASASPGYSGRRVAWGCFPGMGSDPPRFGDVLGLLSPLGRGLKAQFLQEETSADCWDRRLGTKGIEDSGRQDSRLRFPRLVLGIREIRLERPGSERQNNTPLCARGGGAAGRGCGEL